MEKLTELYNRVIEFPQGCELSPNQKSIVFAFIREANTVTNQRYSLSICKRQPVIQHVKKLLTAHGKI